MDITQALGGKVLIGSSLGFKDPAQLFPISKEKRAPTVPLLTNVRRIGKHPIRYGYSVTVIFVASFGGAHTAQGYDRMFGISDVASSTTLSNPTIGRNH